jgi:hypothetical protein
MFPLIIRYKSGLLLAQLIAALFLIFLSLYTGSVYRVVLAAVWLVIGFVNLFNNSILEITPDEILVKNGLGMVSRRYSLNDADIEVRNKKIFYNKKKIFTYSVLFVEDDFNRIREFLTDNNPNLNLQRHLIDGNED